MTTRASELAARVVPPTLKVTSVERDAILEIAYLAVAADKKLSAEEVDALRRIAARLEGKESLTEKELGDLLQRFANWPNREEVDQRLRVLGGTLSPAARTLAYRVAYALAMCDMESSDEEFEFDLQLIDALELTADQASALAGEVQEILQGD